MNLVISYYAFTQQLTAASHQVSYKEPASRLLHLQSIYAWQSETYRNLLINPASSS